MSANKADLTIMYLLCQSVLSVKHLKLIDPTTVSVFLHRHRQGGTELANTSVEKERGRQNSCCDCVSKPRRISPEFSQEKYGYPNE